MEVDVQLEAVVRPRSELHLADLNVKREVADVDGAGGAEDGWRNPHYAAVEADDCHGVTMFLQSSIGAAHDNNRIPRYSLIDCLTDHQTAMMYAVHSVPWKSSEVICSAVFSPYRLRHCRCDVTSQRQWRSLYGEQLLPIPSSSTGHFFKSPKYIYFLWGVLVFLQH